MRTHLPVALMIAICAVTAVAATRLEVTQGIKKFAASDDITVTEVSSEKGTLAAGDTITVKGTYTLASQKNASLLLSVTRDAKQAPLPEHGKGIARKTINTGTGEYEMTISIPQDGWLHLGLYNPETGKPFGQLYFGTKEQMNKIANWNINYVTSEQSGQNNVSFCFSVQADEQVGYEVHLDGKLVSSGKALVKQHQYHNLTATSGDHVLTVKAPGYETWQKTITLLEGSRNKNGQDFLVELKKPASGTTAAANGVPKSGDKPISSFCRIIPSTLDTAYAAKREQAFNEWNKPPRTDEIFRELSKSNIPIYNEHKTDQNNRDIYMPNTMGARYWVLGGLTDQALLKVHEDKLKIGDELVSASYYKNGQGQKVYWALWCSGTHAQLVKEKMREYGITPARIEFTSAYKLQMFSGQLNLYAGILALSSLGISLITLLLVVILSINREQE